MQSVIHPSIANYKYSLIVKMYMLPITVLVSSVRKTISICSYIDSNIPCTQTNLCIKINKYKRRDESCLKWLGLKLKGIVQGFKPKLFC